MNNAVLLSVKCILVLLLISLAPTSKGQVHHPASHQPDTTIKLINHPPRFVIVQSTLAVRATFKVDTYLGAVYQLEADSSGKELWQLLKRITKFTFLDITYPNSVNYSFFLSPLGLRYTYLLNVNTGLTWQWTEDTSTKVTFFESLDDNY